MRKMTTTQAAGELLGFFRAYEEWREDHGLTGKADNVFEIFTSMTDKLGRIGRQIKHQERNDPKEDWPIGLGEDVMGLMAYTFMLLDHYKGTVWTADIFKGFENEMEKAIKQHKQ